MCRVFFFFWLERRKFYLPKKSFLINLLGIIRRQTSHLFILPKNKLIRSEYKEDQFDDIPIDRQAYWVLEYFSSYRLRNRINFTSPSSVFFYFSTLWTTMSTFSRMMNNAWRKQRVLLFVWRLFWKKMCEWMKNKNYWYIDDWISPSIIQFLFSRGL